MDAMIAARLRLLLLMLPCCVAAHAASFDCAKASRPVEKAICSAPRLSADDSTLAAVYHADLDKLTSASVGLLRVDQLQWLAWVQQICRADAGTTQQPGDIAVCLQPLYTERIKQLRTAVVRRDGLSFLTRTQFLAAEETDLPAGVPRDREPHPGFGTLMATWPVADSADEDWAAWNKTVEERLMKMADTAQGGDGSNPGKPLAWNDGMADGLDVELHGRVKQVEHDRVTTGLSMTGMVHGGAHPYETWQTMTWLLEPKRALRAEDVFRADSDWKKIVAEACWKQMSTGDRKQYVFPQIKGPDAKEIQTTILDVGNWTLERDGLHISYPEYSVSPRYALMDDAVVPWSALGSATVQGFAIP